MNGQGDSTHPWSFYNSYNFLSDGDITIQKKVLLISQGMSSMEKKKSWGKEVALTEISIPSKNEPLLAQVCQKVPHSVAA